MSYSSTAAIPQARPVRVLGDTLPGARIRDMLLMLGGAGLTTLGAQVSVHVPGSPVPITGQTLAVVLAGSTLGLRRGMASQLLYLLLGFFLPVYAAPDRSGFSVFWGPNGGYLVGFIVAAALIGWASEQGSDRRLLLAPAMFALGQFAVFAIGVPWLKIAAAMSWSTAISAGFTPFILGGAIKAVVAAAVMPAAWRAARWLHPRD